MRIIYLVIISLLLAILATCESLQNEGGADWATVEFSVDGSKQGSSQASVSGGSIQTAAILAVPGSVTTIGITEYLLDNYDTQLQDLTSNTVRLRIPLNTTIRLAKVVFKEVCSLDEICSSEPTAYNAGLSDPFSVKGDDRTKTVAITMFLPTVASTSPVDGATDIAVDTDISVTFSQAMNTSTLTTNSADTTCSGTMQLSADGFSTCVRMNASPATSNNDQTATMSPAANLSSVTTYNLRVTTGVTDSDDDSLAAVFNSSFSTVLYSALGIPDTSFNSVGYVTINGAAGGDGDDEAVSVAQDSNGRILLCGYSNSATDEDFVILRYNTDGTLDTTFGSSGAVVLDDIALGSGIDECTGIAIDSQNRIVAAGFSENPTDDDIVVLRFDTNGNPDTSFGSNGIFISDNAAGGAAGNDSTWSALTMDENDMILVGGQSAGVGSVDAVVLRIDGDGNLDNSFDSNGIAVLIDPAGAVGWDNVNGITLDSDGRILITGKSSNGADNDMFFARYNTDGSLDSSLNATGYVVYDGGEDEEGNGIIVDGDGKIYITGNGHNGTDLDMGIWRYNSDGSLDSTFGTNGVVVHHNVAGGDTHDQGSDIKIDAYGRILVSGSSRNAASNQDLVILRYDSDGILDDTFGTDGIVIHDNAAGGSGHDYPYQIILNSNQEILAAGYSSGISNWDMAVWRFK